MLATRSATAFDPGDPHAPIGSESWARALRGALQDGLRDVSIGRETLEMQRRLLRETKGYQTLADEHGQPFLLWETFCSTRQPFGLGYDAEAIEAIVAERDTLQSVARRDEATKLARPNGRPPKNKETVDNVNGFAERPSGNTRAAALRRLRAHRPDLYARVLANQITPNAAMIEAGFRDRTMTVPIDPRKAASTLARHFSHEERQVLIQSLQALP